MRQEWLDVLAPVRLEALFDLLLFWFLDPSFVQLGQLPIKLPQLDVSFHEELLQDFEEYLGVQLSVRHLLARIDANLLL